MRLGRRVYWVIVVLTLEVSVFGLGISHAEGVRRSNDLIDEAKFYDGKKVVYQGEAVSAILRRGDHAWINVNDGDNAIGVWCDAAQAGVIKVVGDYKNKGDIVRVEGIFHRACPVHGGELDIHADVLTVVKPGFQFTEKTNEARTGLAMILFFITLSVIVIFRRRI